MIVTLLATFHDNSLIYMAPVRFDHMDHDNGVIGVLTSTSTPDCAFHVKYCVQLLLDAFESVFPGFAADTLQFIFQENAVGEFKTTLYAYISVARSRHVVVPV